MPSSAPPTLLATACGQRWPRPARSLPGHALAPGSLPRGSHTPLAAIGAASAHCALGPAPSTALQLSILCRERLEQLKGRSRNPHGVGTNTPQTPQTPTTLPAPPQTALLPDSPGPRVQTRHQYKPAIPPQPLGVLI